MTKGAGADRSAWPNFAQEWPEHPLLETAGLAFVAGDYLRATASCDALLRADAPADAQAAARNLRARMRPDGRVLILLLLGVGLCVLLAAWYYSHRH